MGYFYAISSLAGRFSVAYSYDGGLCGGAIGLINPIFTPAVTMLIIPLAVLLASLGYFFSERISLERSRS